MAGMTNGDPACEVKIKGEWVRITLEDALRLDAGRVKRCVECHGQVRAHAEGVDGQKAHFEHFEKNPGCSLGNYFSGTKATHRRPLT